MYAKSFLALDGNGRLTGARTAQAAPYAHYTCHLCGSALRYHPQYDTERPRFEHTDDGLTAHGQQCPYVRPERREVRLIKRLQQFVPDALPVVRKATALQTMSPRLLWGAVLHKLPDRRIQYSRTTQEEICEF